MYFNYFSNIVRKFSSRYFHISNNYLTNNFIIPKLLKFNMYILSVINIRKIRYFHIYDNYAHILIDQDFVNTIEYGGAAYRWLQEQSVPRGGKRDIYIKWTFRVRVNGSSIGAACCVAASWPKRAEPALPSFVLYLRNRSGIPRTISFLPRLPH